MSLAAKSRHHSWHPFRVIDGGAALAQFLRDNTGGPQVREGQFLYVEIDSDAMVLKLCAKHLVSYEGGRW